MVYIDPNILTSENLLFPPRHCNINHVILFLNIEYFQINSKNRKKDVIVYRNIRNQQDGDLNFKQWTQLVFIAKIYKICETYVLLHPIIS